MKTISIMRIFTVIIAITVLNSCLEDNSAPRVCDDIFNCLTSSSWTTQVDAISNGHVSDTPEAGGVLTFNKDKTGTSTEIYLQGYANGVYYSNFTYVLDENKFTLTISFDLPQGSPPQVQVLAITSAYENKILMETPMIDGKVIFTLTQ